MYWHQSVPINMRTEVHSEIYYGYKQRKRSFTGLLLGGPHIRPVRPGQAHPRSSAVQRKPCTTPAQRVSCSRQLIHVSSLHFTSLWTQNCEFPLNTNQTKTEGWRVTSLPPALFLWWQDFCVFVFFPSSWLEFIFFRAFWFHLSYSKTMFSSRTHTLTEFQLLVI